MTWLHRIYAHLGGYFWAHCERCGRGYGGHQWREPLTDAMQRALGSLHGHCAYCPRCARSRDAWDPGWRPTHARPRFKDSRCASG